MGINIKVWTINWKFQQMSRYLDLIQGAFSQNWNETEKTYDEKMSIQVEEEEYYLLEDHYTDKFIEIGRDFPNLLFSSFIITWYAFVEQQLAKLCDSFKSDILELDSNRQDKGIRRSRKLLLTAAKYEIEAADWQELIVIGKLRNLLVHNGNELNGSPFQSGDKEVALVSKTGNTYYFSIDPALLIYLQKHELLEQMNFSLEILPTLSYCKHLVEFGRSFLIKLQRFARRFGTIERVFHLDSYEALLPRPTRKNYQYL
ncbi:MAG: hypothetical protein ACAF41_21320 [Leptolyngbya sp. BL-A-14]